MVHIVRKNDFSYQFTVQYVVPIHLLHCFSKFCTEGQKISFCVHLFISQYLHDISLLLCDWHCRHAIGILNRALHTFFGHWSNLVSVKIIANCTLYVWHQSQWKVSKPPGWSFSDLFNALSPSNKPSPKFIPHRHVLWLTANHMPALTLICRLQPTLGMWPPRRM